MSLAPAIVWFRQDLRLQDNPALHAAIARGGGIVPLFVLDDAGEGRWPLGGASRWWLHHSLAALDGALRERGSRLILARGEVATVLREIARATGAAAIFWNRRYEPAAVARDATIKSEFAAAGLEVKSCNGSLLHEPHTIANKQGRPFQVFTPYWRHCLGQPVTAPIKVTAATVPAPAAWPSSLELAELGLLPRRPWDAGFGAAWQPGEEGATKRLRVFAAATWRGRRDETPACVRRARHGELCRRA